MFKKTLQNLAQTLEDTYQLSVDRIKSQNDQLRKIAFNVFLWVAIASPSLPLTVEEVQHAITAQELASDQDHLDSDDLVTEEFLLEACAGLVNIEQDSKGRSIFRLVHYTALLFFKSQCPVLFSNAHAEMTQACLEYLLLDPFKSGPCSTKSEVHKRLERYPFYLVASSEWEKFAADSEVSCKNTIIRFLRNDEAIKSASQIWSSEALFIEARRRFYESLDINIPWDNELTPDWLFAREKYPPGCHGLGLASWFGLSKISEALIDNGADIDGTEGGNGRTALTIAIRREHTPVIDMLIARNASLDIVDSDGRSPLVHLVRVAEYKVFLSKTYKPKASTMS